MKLPGWGLPEAEVQALSTTIRRIARLLWSLHLCFAEGFDTVRPVLTPHALVLAIAAMR